MSCFCGVIVNGDSFFIMYAGRYELDRGPRWKLRGQTLLKRPEAHPYVLSREDEERIIRLCGDYGLSPKEGGRWVLEVSTAENVDGDETLEVGKTADGYVCAIWIMVRNTEDTFAVQSGGRSEIGMAALLSEGVYGEGITCCIVQRNSQSITTWRLTTSFDASASVSVSGHWSYSTCRVKYVRS